MYLLHLLIALAIAVPTGLWALGYAVGGRNFETPDNSHNNHLAAWMILGEGYQNNHHHCPATSARGLVHE